MREFKDDRVLEADNAFARQGSGVCSESLIIDEERRFPHRKDRSSPPVWLLHWSAV